MDREFLTEVFIYLWYVIATGGVQSWFEADFAARYTGRPARRWMPALYLLAIYGAATLSLLLRLPVPASLMLYVALLFLYGLALLRLPPARAAAPCVIVFTLATMREGFVSVASRFAVGNIHSPRAGTAVLFLLSIGFLALFCLALRLIARRLPLPGDAPLAGGLYLLLLPCAVMVWAIRLSLGLNSSYSVINSDGLLLEPEVLPLGACLLWLCVSLVVFTALLIACQKILRDTRQQTVNLLLEEEVRAQRLYLREAAERSRRLDGWRHDTHNHFLVLQGLLEKGDAGEARAYLAKLKDSAALAPLPADTGNPVVDVLLGEKAAYAREQDIPVDWAVRLPQDGGVDDVDLCVVLANGLDNAIAASLALPRERRSIRLRVEQRQAFLIIEMTNAIPEDTPPVRYGTGLSNIGSVAQKYNGTLQTEALDGQFRLSVLMGLPGGAARA